jgi:hypothetical protein
MMWLGKVGNVVQAWIERHSPRESRRRSNPLRDELVARQNRMVEELAVLRREHALHESYREWDAKVNDS